VKLVLVLGFLTTSFLYVTHSAAAQDFDSLGLDTAPSYLGDTSEFIRIDRIFIVGNRKTKENIITRELNIYEGQWINKKEIGEILEWEKNKIFNTSLFLSVDFSTVKISKYEIDIIIKVSERWYTFPIPLVDIAARDFNDWWYNWDRDFSRLIFGLEYKQYNVRGRNETLGFLGQVGFTDAFSISYKFEQIFITSLDPIFGINIAYYRRIILFSACLFFSSHLSTCSHYLID